MTDNIEKMDVEKIASYSHIPSGTYRAVREKGGYWYYLKVGVRPKSEDGKSSYVEVKREPYLKVGSFRSSRDDTKIRYFNSTQAAFAMGEEVLSHIDDGKPVCFEEDWEDVE